VIEELAADVRALLDQVESEGARLPLIQDKVFAHAPEYDGPPGTLFRDADGRFFVMRALWAPGEATPIHDHGTWGVVALVRGRLIVREYRRRDDGNVPGYAVVEFRLEEVVGAGRAFAFAPPHDIHQMENRSDAEAVTLHVYGREVESCNVYEPYHKRVTQERCSHTW
jgi:predicted metal-dependent enzyme (double-stranded beta helix superfamily)